MRPDLSTITLQLSDVPGKLAAAVKKLPLVALAATPGYAAGWWGRAQVEAAAASRGQTVLWTLQHDTGFPLWPTLDVAAYAMSVWLIALGATWALTRNLSAVGRRAPALAVLAAGYSVMHEGGLYAEAYLCSISTIPPALFSGLRTAYIWILAAVAVQLVVSAGARQGLSDFRLTARFDSTTILVTVGVVTAVFRGVWWLYGQALTAAWPYMVANFPTRLIEELYIGAGPNVLHVTMLALYYSTAHALLAPLVADATTLDDMTAPGDTAQDEGAHDGTNLD
jgi:hypothetical protein